jgi:quercetin dioxygenase-like cupin family protein
LSVDEEKPWRVEENVEDTTNGTITYVPPGEGKSFWTVGGHMATFKATSEDTGGAYTITEETWPPQVGPPPHIHHTQEETFYVLEGEMEFITDGVTTRAVAGSLVRIPRGVLRDYRNVGSEPARVLVLFAPGGFEGFLRRWASLLRAHLLRLKIHQMWRGWLRRLRSMAARYHLLRRSS